MTVTYTDKEIIDALNYVDRLSGGNTSYYNYRRYKKPDMPSPSAVANRFGGWNNAKEAAGLNTNPPKQDRVYTDDEILEAYKEAEDIFGKEITHDDYKKWAELNDKPSYATLVRRLGGITKLKKEKDINEFCKDCAEKKGCNISLSECEYYDERLVI